MPFTVEEFHDLVRLLEQHPQWRAELRRLVLSEELLELPALVRRLAEAQARTEQRVEQLAEAQARTEQRVEQLAEAQARTEQRVEQLAEAQARTEQRVEQLAEAQARTEQRVEQLAEAQARTEQQLAVLAARMGELTEHVEALDRRQRRVQQELGALTELVGAGAEAQARPVLVELLRQKGYRLLERPRPIAVDGEVDVAAPVEDQAGQRLWVLVEARARLRRGDVQGWHRRLEDHLFLARLRAAGVTPPFLVYAFGLQVYADAEAAGQAVGIGILAQEGELVPPAPRQPAL